MSSPKIEITKATNYEFLKEHNLQIEVPKNKVHRVLLIHYLFDNFNGSSNSKLNQLNEVLFGVKRTVIKYAYLDRFDYTERVVGKRVLADPKQLKADSESSFFVHLVDVETKSPKYTFAFSKQAIYEVKADNAIKIDIEKALEIREEMQAKKSIQQPKNRRERERLVIEICNLIASGTHTILEACNRIEVTMTDFMSWVHTDPLMAKHLQHANIVRRFVEETNTYLELTQYRAMLVKQGHRKKVKIQYRKIFTPQYMNGTHVEGDKDIYEEQFSLGEVNAAIKGIEENIIPQVIPGEETGSKSKEELKQDLNELQDRYMKAVEAKMKRKE